ncbi:MAG TPA: DUF4331 domain-containing protein [Actinomycetota bacterium]|nr:DUF4331 domain-containing protein [Actinomycetota bacterium]
MASVSASRVRRAAALAVTGALAVAAFAGLGPVASTASSHREAPLVSADPPIDATDLYAFVPSDAPNSVALIGSWIPFEEPAGGPNFYLWAEKTNYDINIDNDGDARPDVIYRWRFTTHHRNPDSFIYNNGPVTSLGDTNLLIYQTYDLTRIKGDDSTKLIDDAKVVPSNVGAASMPGYNANLFDAGVRAVNNIRSWVGQSDDAFFLDLRVFDLLYGGDFSEAGDDTLDGFNVNTMALRVPMSQLRGPNDGVIGVWTTASRPSVRVQGANGSISWRGDNVQVSRLGMPLVNEVVVPVGSKDFFNGSKPRNDAVFLPKVNDPELPHLISAVYSGVFPKVPDTDPGTAGVQRSDLVKVFLTGLPGLNKPTGVRPAEMLRLNMDIAPCTSSCSTLGAVGGDTAGFPNGRRLTDDVIDIALRVVMGVLIPGHDTDADGLSDGVGANDVAFNASFPYVAYPHSGSNADPH